MQIYRISVIHATISQEIRNRLHIFIPFKLQQRPFFTPYIYNNISNFAGNE